MRRAAEKKMANLVRSKFHKKSLLISIHKWRHDESMLSVCDVICIFFVDDWRFCWLQKENEMKTDDERTNMRPLTALDEIVLDILGKGNGTTQKNEIEIPENASFLDPAFMARIKYEEDDDDENLGDDNDDSLGGQVQMMSQFTWLGL